MHYDEHWPHTDHQPAGDDDEYTGNPGPGYDDADFPEPQVPEWLQLAIEAQEEEERINELARQHEEEMARKRSTAKSPPSPPITPPA